MLYAVLDWHTERVDGVPGGGGGWAIVADESGSGVSGSGREGETGDRIEGDAEARASYDGASISAQLDSGRSW